jgi:hypothetical protein
MQTSHFLLLGFLGFTAAGCASISSYARVTSGRIGCPAEQIDIREVQDDGKGPRSWVAGCSGKQYACSSSGGLDNVRSEVVCSEFGSAPARP